MGNNTNKDTELQSKIKDCVDEKGCIDYKKLNELKEKWELSICDIAIVGRAGSGKSTLINRLLGVPNKDPDEEAQIKREIETCKVPNHEKCHHKYAPTDSNECTKNPVPYMFPDSTRVRLWDLPGYGTTTYSTIKKYWEQLAIDKYHAFLVVSEDNRPFTDMQEMVKYLVQDGKGDRILWVRTHFDKYFKNEQAEREKFLAYIATLATQTIPPKSFCTSGKYSPERTGRKHLYDIDKLKAAIITTVPEEIQCHLAAKFQGYSEELLHIKFVTLQKWAVLQVLLSTVTSAGASFIPIAGAVASGFIDFALVAAFYEHTKEVYGFSSLDELLARLHVSEQLTVLMRTQLSTQDEKLTRGIMARVLAGIVVSSAAEAASSVVPFVGAAVAGVVSGSAMTWACHYINTSFRDLALQVISFIDSQGNNPNNSDDDDDDHDDNNNNDAQNGGVIFIN